MTAGLVPAISACRLRRTWLRMRFSIRRASVRAMPHCGTNAANGETLRWPGPPQVPVLTRPGAKSSSTVWPAPRSPCVPGR